MKENSTGDDPVTNYLPDFQLYDPSVTRELRVRDLLLHNTGVGNADFLWAGHGVIIGGPFCTGCGW